MINTTANFSFNIGLFGQRASTGNLNNSSVTQNYGSAWDLTVTDWHSEVLTINPSASGAFDLTALANQPLYENNSLASISLLLLQNVPNASGNTASYLTIGGSPASGYTQFWSGTVSLYDDLHFTASGGLRVTPTNKIIQIQNNDAINTASVIFSLAGIDT